MIRGYQNQDYERSILSRPESCNAFMMNSAPAKQSARLSPPLIMKAFLRRMVLNGAARPSSGLVDAVVVSCVTRYTKANSSGIVTILPNILPLASAIPAQTQKIHGFTTLVKTSELFLMINGMEVQHLIQKIWVSQRTLHKNHPPIGFDIYCSQCGAKTIRNTPIYVICPNHKNTRICKETRKININKARRATYEQIALDPGTRWDEWNALRLELQKDRPRHIREAEKERDECRDRIGRFIAALTSGNSELDLLRKHIRKHESDLEDVEKKLASLEALPALIMPNKRKFKALIRAYRNEPEVLVRFLITSVTIDIDNEYTVRELNPDYQGIAEILKLYEAPKAA